MSIVRFISRNIGCVYDHWHCFTIETEAKPPPSFKLKKLFISINLHFISHVIIYNQINKKLSFPWAYNTRTWVTLKHGSLEVMSVSFSKACQVSAPTVEAMGETQGNQYRRLPSLWPSSIIARPSCSRLTGFLANGL